MPLELKQNAMSIMLNKQYLEITSFRSIIKVVQCLCIYNNFVFEEIAMLHCSTVKYFVQCNEILEIFNKVKIYFAYYFISLLNSALFSFYFLLKI